jgi:YVTN family beta-propeller protein
VAVFTPETGGLKEIKVGRIPYDVIAIPQGMVYVMNQDGGHHGTLSVIDTKNDQVVSTISIGLMPWALTSSSDGRWLYVVRDDPGYLYQAPFASDPNPSTRASHYCHGRHTDR